MTIFRTGKTMAKSDTKPRAKNYGKIVKAAQEEFALKGLSGARMQSIANRAGLPKANIHYYFKDKVIISCVMILPLLSKGSAASPIRPVAIGIPN